MRWPLSAGNKNWRGKGQVKVSIKNNKWHLLQTNKWYLQKCTANIIFNNVPWDVDQSRNVGFHHSYIQCTKGLNYCNKTRKINKIHKNQKGRHINDPIWLDNATYPKSPREAKKQFIKLTYEFRKSLDTELICKTQLFSYILKAKNWR